MIKPTRLHLLGEEMAAAKHVLLLPVCCFRISVRGSGRKRQAARLDVELPVGQLQRLLRLQRRLRHLACLQDQQRPPQVALRGLRDQSASALWHHTQAGFQTSLQKTMSHAC